ncbi:hypothetical protein RQP46_003042 [Phenoliferia psychrophenolica]
MHPNKRRKPDEAAAAPVDPVAQEASVKAYMFHAVKLLQKALKKSRTFEVQKLGRKLKTSREPKEGVADAALVADLEAQVLALKDLAVDHLPAHLLTTRLPKLTYLHPILPSVLSSYPPPPQPFLDLDPKSPAGKARNRTLANKVVKEAWDEVVRAVGKRMGEEVDERPVKAAPVVVKKPIVEPSVMTEEAPVVEQKVPVEGKRLSKRAERAAKGAAKALLPKPGMDPGRKALLEAARDGSEADGEDSEADDDEEGDDEAEVLRELARLGSGSEASDSEDGGPQSGSEEESGGDDDDGFGSDDSFPAQAAPPAKKARREDPTAAKRKPPTSSAFLPSLASGYISYSDSDGEDAKWVKEAEKGDKKERKNRRGQRARRAIWEQKYGSGANHIVADIGGAPAATKGGKGAAKPTKKAARSSGATAAAADAAPPSFDPAKAGGANSQPVLERKVRPLKIEQGMHPSWEAKRRAADAAERLAAAPKGKKITF